MSNEIPPMLWAHFDPCDPAVYANGRVIAISDCDNSVAEAICQALRPYLKDGVMLDWHFVGGRAVFKVLELTDDRSQK